MALFCLSGGTFNNITKLTHFHFVYILSTMNNFKYLQKPLASTFVGQSTISSTYKNDQVLDTVQKPNSSKSIELFRKVYKLLTATAGRQTKKACKIAAHPLALPLQEKSACQQKKIEARASTFATRSGRSKTTTYRNWARPSSGTHSV